MQHSGIPHLYALILAAGLSSRMGGHPKALVNLGQGTMLAMAHAALTKGGVEHVFVVTGHGQADVAAAAADIGAECVHNADFDQGMFSSLCAGFARILEEEHKSAANASANTHVVTYAGTHIDVPAAVLLLPVDAPLVSAWSVSLLAAYWQAFAAEEPEKANDAIFIPCFDGRCGHPPLLGLRHLKKVLENKAVLASSGGLRAYLASLMDEEARRQFCQGLAPKPERIKDSFSAATPVAINATPGLFLPCPPVRGGERTLFFPLPDAGILSDLDTAEDCGKARAFLSLTRQRTMPSPEESMEWLSNSGIGENKIRHSIMVAAGSLALGQALRRAGKAVDLPLHIAGGILHDVIRKCSLTDKKCKAHARRAMDNLILRGWPDCARVVSAHTVLPNEMLAALGIGMRDLQVVCRMEPKCPGGQRDSLLFGLNTGADTPQVTAIDALPLSQQPFPLSATSESGSCEYIPDTVLNACMAVYLADKFFFMDRFVSIDERFDIVIERFKEDREAIQAVLHRKTVAKGVCQWFYSITGKRPETLLAGCVDELLTQPPEKERKYPTEEITPANPADPDETWQKFLANLFNAQNISTFSKPK